MCDLIGGEDICGDRLCKSVGCKLIDKNSC